MAVIKIPSKHIYEMQNEKVIDNDIDKIEVSAKSVSIVSDSGNVYNETVRNGFVVDSLLSNMGSKQYSRATNDELYPYSAAIAYMRVYPTYVTKTYVIQKSQNTAFVTKVFVGKDENGNANIKYSLIGNIKKGNLTANSTIVTPQYHPFDDSKDVTNFQFDTNSIVKSETIQESNVSYDLDNEDLLKTSYTYQYPYNTSIYYSVSTSVTLPQKIDVFNVSVVENDTDYTLTFSILAGLNIQKYYGLNKYKDPWGAKTVNFPLSGTYEEYIPTQVSVSFYGNTIGIDLQDNTITIGDGKNVISFQGNELVQTTNSPSIESQYQTVLDEWEEGKETATLRCGIADYYSTDGAKAVSLSKENGLPMSFQIGDIVCPYVFGSNGKDRPMSINKDGTPKNFGVISKRMIYDGAVWQEIGLQEEKP